MAKVKFNNKQRDYHYISLVQEALKSVHLLPKSITYYIGDTF